jgi:hypothetical protein
MAEWALCSFVELERLEFCHENEAFVSCSQALTYLSGGDNVLQQQAKPYPCNATLFQ